MTLPEYPETKSHPRRRCILLYLAENRKSFELQNVTIRQSKAREDSAIMLSWPMTTKAANSLEQQIKDLLSKFRVKGNHYRNCNQAIKKVWGLGEKLNYLEWV